MHIYIYARSCNRVGFSHKSPPHSPVTMRMGMALNCARFQWPRALFYRPQSFAKVLALVSQTQKTLRRYTTANATSISANPNSITPPPPTPTIPASALSFGQPIHETHPHLIGPGDRKFFPISLFHESANHLRQ